jgi:hypothetical protein
MNVTSGEETQAHKKVQLEWLINESDTHCTTNFNTRNHESSNQIN